MVGPRTKLTYARRDWITKREMHPQRVYGDTGDPDADTVTALSLGEQGYEDAGVYWKRSNSEFAHSGRSCPYRG